MNIILGATGRVGSAVAEELIKEGKPVKAVIRDPRKAEELQRKGMNVAIADYFDRQALKKAFQGGDTAFLLTPEDPETEDPLKSTEGLLENYKAAVEHAGILQIIGLSSFGAQHSEGTGNLLMSHKLEQTFDEPDVRKIFVRPAYYFSNWLPYLETVKNEGVLPTFFPADLKIPMVSPMDVAQFIAGLIAKEKEENRIYEIMGPESYSPDDVAGIFSKILKKEVNVAPIPREQWEETIGQIGFKGKALENFVEMTEAVIRGKARPESEPVRLKTGLEKYLSGCIGQML